MGGRAVRGLTGVTPLPVTVKDAHAANLAVRSVELHPAHTLAQPAAQDETPIPPSTRRIEPVVKLDAVVAK